MGDIKESAFALHLGRFPCVLFTLLLSFTVRRLSPFVLSFACHLSFDWLLCPRRPSSWILTGLPRTLVCLLWPLLAPWLVCLSLLPRPHNWNTSPEANGTSRSLQMAMEASELDAASSRYNFADKITSFGPPCLSALRLRSIPTATIWRRYHFDELFIVERCFTHLFEHRLRHWLWKLC